MQTKLSSTRGSRGRFLSALLLLPSIASAAEEGLKLSTPTPEERIESIRRARVWEPTDVASKDLYNGPAGDPRFAVDEEVTCDFVPKPLGGMTPKFLCRLQDGRIFKVKYEEGHRAKEAFGEVLGTRLFWALGFYADRILPVRVTCRGCPRHPWKYVSARRRRGHRDGDGGVRSFPSKAEIGTYTFESASMEDRLDVEPIEEHEDQGWSWDSLGLVDERAGGASKAEIDAFRLLTAFVKNSDTISRQNALACPRSELVKDDAGKVTCRRPIMYVDDLGSVFGKGGFITSFGHRVDYKGWKKRAVWRDRESCKARLPSMEGIFRSSTLNDPVISEEGRALLATQIGRLSDAQIADLFRAARIESLHQTMTDGPSGRREVTVQDWVELFKLKRDEITKHPGCKTARPAPLPAGR